MERRDRRKLYIAIAVVLALLGVVVIGLRWTWYYDLNDDMLMQQILAGTYTGTPESHNIQNLYPFSLIVSGLYRIVAGFDWYALILLVLAAVCYVMTIVRALCCTGEHPVFKIGAVVGITMLYGAILLYHLVYVQYTVIVGMMGATAGFLILTSDASAARGNDTDDIETAPRANTFLQGTIEFLKENIPSFVLIFIGYAIRSEMMMFMIPFCALAVLFRIASLGSIKEIVLRIVASLLVLGIGVGAIYGIDAAAYSSPEWSEFRDLFDARTQLYDFASAPPYEGNEEFYESIGLSESEAQLFTNYNFGIDERIDSKVMQQVADYASAQRLETKSSKERIREAVWVYLYQKVLGSSEMPWNMVAFVLYGLVAITALFEILSAIMDGRSAEKSARTGTEASAESESCGARIWSAIGMLAAAGLILTVRTGLWLYLLYSGRPVARLTHSMYYAEALMLFVLLFYKRRFDITAPFKAAFILCACAYALGAQTTLIETEAAERAVNNVPYEAFLSYASENPDSFYVVDVYSTVDFSQEMFDNSRAASNWTLCGGWASKSPLESKVLAAHGITSIAEGLTSDQNVYFVARQEYDTQWIVDYYESQGVSVVVSRVDMIDEYWAVYSIDTWDL